MSYQHSNVYIVRIVDTEQSDQTHTWFVGPYGSTRAEQVADQLESLARRSTESDALRERECFVEALFSDDDCLRVGDYERVTPGVPVLIDRLDGSPTSPLDRQPGQSSPAARCVGPHS